MSFLAALSAAFQVQWSFGGLLQHASATKSNGTETKGGNHAFAASSAVSLTASQTFPDLKF